MHDTIDYGRLMHEQMRGLIRQVLQQVADEGLPGEHHFFISFDTTHPDAELADWLRARYPEEITVVIQHWYEDLEVDEDGFGITLNFGDQPERLYIPFDALLTFVDPSVEFGLRFESQVSDDEELDDLEEHGMGDDDTDPDGSGGNSNGGSGEVVSLDKFRKQ
ncbi:hypothetical protein CDV50_05710 [Haematobacter massiliensis]|uniref:Uncharacterized protein n=1 Tax=Haematobacter massiliensis TaxID=195105 RepID=A0A086YCP9_9RHOB|nr:ClpXP protease specificity-enhancing factor SspB [Haematobacter massiliensis]KFI32049.1 hypothetical protein CN97_06455 [Haematobacter massiliensis]OWJ72652.1 hypothetical protein CDV50_05710 [Haematobacter massiliensis]OWJ86791.1 hypothetical protein CDV51_09685 [Haematobacter massiliensis]QBJ24435.1 hypothetical protein HmaOT1_09305 [Haematobacter massiliensis]